MIQLIQLIRSCKVFPWKTTFGVNGRRQHKYCCWNLHHLIFKLFDLPANIHFVLNEMSLVEKLTLHLRIISRWLLLTWFLIWGLSVQSLNGFLVPLLLLFCLLPQIYTFWWSGNFRIGILVKMNFVSGSKINQRLIWVGSRFYVIHFPD